MTEQAILSRTDRSAAIVTDRAPDLSPVMQVRDLNVSFQTRSSIVSVVRGASFALFEGETLAIIGESGSGKSTIANSLQLTPWKWASTMR